MKITWDESMSTGVARLDAQHRQLIQKFNEFTHILEHPTLVREKAGEILDFLQFYASWHFKHEEECMEQYQCPVADANKKAHAEFLSMFGKFYSDWQKNTMDLEMARTTHAQLYEWIVKHIVNVDTRLRSCIPKDN